MAHINGDGAMAECLIRQQAGEEWIRPFGPVLQGKCLIHNASS